MSMRTGPPSPCGMARAAMKSSLPRACHLDSRAACFPHINSLPKGVCLHGETVPAGIRHCQALVELRRVPLSARHPQYLDSGTGGHRHRLPDRIRLRHSEHHSPQQERPARQAVLSGADPGSGPDLRGDLPGLYQSALTRKRLPKNTASIPKLICSDFSHVTFSLANVVA